MKFYLQIVHFYKSRIVLNMKFLVQYLRFLIKSGWLAFLTVMYLLGISLSVLLILTYYCSNVL